MAVNDDNAPVQAARIKHYAILRNILVEPSAVRSEDVIDVAEAPLPTTPRTIRNIQGRIAERLFEFPATLCAALAAARHQ